ncbi:MAG: GNAT family N-acetyltransferase [Verrucomicrobia bacterium]|nr:GNAT family N-acetyltransferase [Verrucomicrobiota bacterium]
MAVHGLTTCFGATDTSITTSVANCLVERPSDDGVTALLKTVGKVALVVSAVLLAIPTLGTYPYFVFRVFQEIANLERVPNVPTIPLQMQNPKGITLLPKPPNVDSTWVPKPLTLQKPRQITVSDPSDLPKPATERLTHDSPLLVEHQVPDEAKIILDEIFDQSIPSFTSALISNESRRAISNLLHDRGIGFVKVGTGNNVGFLRDLDYVIKIQMGEFSQPDELKHNLQRIVMNDAIRDCIEEKNLQHITYIKKSIYPLPSVNKGDEINDTNSIVVAQKVNCIEVDINELTDEEYNDLITVAAHVKYADLKSSNLTWIQENGVRKIAFLDTEDIAKKFVTTDDALEYYCKKRYWQNHNKDIDAIIDIANSLRQTQPERARKIIQLLLAYTQGIGRIRPPAGHQMERHEMFAKAAGVLEKEIQELLDQVNIAHRVTLFKAPPRFVPEPLVQEPIQTVLSRIAPHYRTVLGPKAQAALGKIEALFAKEVPQFEQVYEKHAIHDAVAVITEELTSRPDLQKEWRVFLSAKPKCLLPDGSSTTCDFSLEAKRLDGALPTVKAECLDPHVLTRRTGLLNLFSEEMLQGIAAVVRDSFSAEELKGGRLETPGDIGFKCNEELCITVHDEQSKEIYGVLFGAQLRLASSGRSVLYINAVSRLAKASRLGVGSKLVEKFFETVRGNPQLRDIEIVLDVDKDNAAACALYKKCGMTISQDRGRYAIHRVQRRDNDLVFVYNSKHTGAVSSNLYHPSRFRET